MSDQHPSTERSKLYLLYLPYQWPSRCHSFLSCRPSFSSCGWQSESYFRREMSSRTQAQLWCVQFSACEEVYCTELYTLMAVLDLWTNPVKVIICWTHGGQIAGIAFGSVGAPLYKHERRGQKQQQQHLLIPNITINI